MESDWFEWDDEKAGQNRIDHDGVTFEEAETAFYDEFGITFNDEEHSEDEDRLILEDEDRLILIGTSLHRRVLLVVYTERVQTDQRVRYRIISARKATAAERRVYEFWFESR